MNYIVIDLEWNQANGTTEPVPELPFEIIEIGAVKVDEAGRFVGEFNELIRPCVYTTLNYVTSKLIHLRTHELERGKPFKEVYDKLIEWIGEEEYIFCTWGTLDILELQRNIDYHGLKSLSEEPIQYIDAQKLYALIFDEGDHERKSLEHAVDELYIEKDIPFHRAFSDAYYTAKVLNRLKSKDSSKLSYISYDVYMAPKSRSSEIKIVFDNYAKYISRTFDNKVLLFADREVSSTKCYKCRRNLKKKIKWFTMNSRHYYALAYCEEHGYLKGKIRLKRDKEGRLFVVKTTKLISEADAEKLKYKYAHMGKRLKKENREI